ncbi:uncharacterized protein A4U43_UnF8580 [Asparagus officinalis]|uniref:Aldehyde dehydrogenase domain-containing protein n=1 Tax=Asparagus officinalis TaxID=4686 RepID=A0A1R3L5X6_ASPOF|nr:uncharacterized protein A4U43_UnF8580 [Asparagus officinalis]
MPKREANFLKLNCPPIPHPQPFDSNRELLPRPFHPQQSSPCPSCCVDGGDGGDGDGGDYGVFAASHRPPPPPATAIGASLMMETGEALDLRFPWRILKILWLGFVKGAIGPWPPEDVLAYFCIKHSDIFRYAYFACCVSSLLFVFFLTDNVYHQAESLEEAIHIVNNNRYSNGASIFTMSGISARKFQTKIEAGQCNIMSSKY